MCVKSRRHGGSVFLLMWVVCPISQSINKKMLRMRHNISKRVEPCGVLGG